MTFSRRMQTGEDPSHVSALDCFSHFLRLPANRCLHLRRHLITNRTSGCAARRRTCESAKSLLAARHASCACVRGDSGLVAAQGSTYEIGSMPARSQIGDKIAQNRLTMTSITCSRTGCCSRVHTVFGSLICSTRSICESFSAEALTGEDASLSAPARQPRIVIPSRGGRDARLTAARRARKLLRRERPGQRSQPVRRKSTRT